MAKKNKQNMDGRSSSDTLIVESRPLWIPEVIEILQSNPRFIRFEKAIKRLEELNVPPAEFPCFSTLLKQAS